VKGKVGTLDPWSRKESCSGSAEKWARKVRLAKAGRQPWQDPPQKWGLCLTAVRI